MDLASLAQENAALKALLARSQSDLAEHQAALAASEEARRRLEIIIDDLRREKFGSKSEKLTPDQYQSSARGHRDRSGRLGRGAGEGRGDHQGQI